VEQRKYKSAAFLSTTLFRFFDKFLRRTHCAVINGTFSGDKPVPDRCFGKKLQ